MGYKDILKKYESMDSIYSASEEERRKDLQTLNRIANADLTRLKKAGMTEWAYSTAKAYLESADKEKFTTSKTDNLRQVNTDLVRVLNFLNSKTHSVSGYRQVEKQHEEQLLKHGININKDGFDKEKFWDFFRTKEWKEVYKKKMDSGQVFGVIHKAIDSGKEIKEILDDFQKYSQSEIKWNDIIEKYGQSEWNEV